MTIFETDSRHAFTSGVLIIAACVIAGLGLAAGMILLPVSLLSFVLGAAALALLILAAWLGYQLYGLTHITYAVDRNAFVIRIGAVRHIVPMDSVVRLARGSGLKGIKASRPPLSGWWVGRGFQSEVGPIQFYATAPTETQYVLITERGSFGLSPYDAELFEQTFNAQLALGATQKVVASSLAPLFLDQQLWSDSAAKVLLILGLGINLLAFGISAARYPVVPSQIVLHFNATGIADRFGSTAQIFAPPAIALLLFAVNLVIGLIAHRRGEPLAGYLVWGGNVVVQLTFLVAVITIGFTSGLTS